MTRPVHLIEQQLPLQERNENSEAENQTGTRTEGETIGCKKFRSIRP